MKKKYTPKKFVKFSEPWEAHFTFYCWFVTIKVVMPLNFRRFKKIFLILIHIICRGLYEEQTSMPHLRNKLLWDVKSHKSWEKHK